LEAHAEAALLAGFASLPIPSHKNRFRARVFRLHNFLRIDHPLFCAYIHITANEIPAGWFIVLEKKESKRRSGVGCEASAEA